jgi:hypothetical protein
MNKIARVLGSPFAFGVGVLVAVAFIGVGIEFGWRSSMFHVARTLMISATAVGLLIVLWSRADRARRLTREVDRLARLRPEHRVPDSSRRGGAS